MKSSSLFGWPRRLAGTVVTWRVLRAFPHLDRTSQCLGTSRTLPKMASHPSQVGELLLNSESRGQHRRSLRIRVRRTRATQTDDASRIRCTQCHLT